MDEQESAELAHNQAVNNEVLADSTIEYPRLSKDSDLDDLTNRQKAMLGTDPHNPDTDGDGASDAQQAVLKIDSTKSNSSQPIEDKSLSEHQTSPDLDREQEPDSQNTELMPDSKTGRSNSNTSDAEESSFINTLCQKLLERSNLDMDNATLSIYQGANQLYRGNFQTDQINTLTTEQQDLLQKALDDPTGLQGELTITVNDQKIFHIQDGFLKLDCYGLAGAQLTQSPSQNQTQPALIQPKFDAPAVYNRYQQEVQAQSPAQLAQFERYEHIAQKVLNDGLSQSEAKQVLKLDPFHQNLALSIGEKEAERYTVHLLNSLGSGGVNHDRIAALENRGQNFESFNQQLLTQIEMLNQKIDRLSQSKAFQSNSPGFNQFLTNISQSIANTWQATLNALRQKAGEISLSVVEATAKTSAQWFGEETTNGQRAIDTSNGQRMAIDRTGSIFVTKTPNIEAASLYQRLSQGIDKSLPPSLAVKQIAQSALKEQFTTAQIHSILSQAPKFIEISDKQGAGKAHQFASVALAAAQRQNAIESQPQVQRSAHKQSQHQA